MYAAATAVIVLYLILFLLSAREILEKVPSPIMKPFYRMAQYLYRKLVERKGDRSRKKQVLTDLQRLYPSNNQEAIYRDYYVGKLALSLLICLVGTLLGVLVSAKAGADMVLEPDGTIIRGSYEEGAGEIELEADFEDGRQQVFSLQIGAKHLTEQELDILLQQFKEQLPSFILDENTSLQEVYLDLMLEESYEGYPFLIEWRSNRPDIVTSSGTVYGITGESVEVILTAKIRYAEMEDVEWKQEIAVCVVAPELSPEEVFLREMEEMLVLSEREGRSETEWKLPESFQGQMIHWRQVVTNYGTIIWIGALATAALVFFLSDKDLHSNLEEKRSVMKRAYPDVVQKLALYMGAGLTVRGAFQRIAATYEHSKSSGKYDTAIYEEIGYACRELQSGVSESLVYEHLGKRTGLQEYIRLCTLLVQNLKRGNSTLLQRLKEEADKACIEQLQNSRRLGEEASTKLLLPMILMLVVVMLLIMIPAFSSAGI